MLGAGGEHRGISRNPAPGTLSVRCNKPNRRRKAPPPNARGAFHMDGSSSEGRAPAGGRETGAIGFPDILRAKRHRAHRDRAETPGPGQTKDTAR